ncbi:MAG: helicase-related protein [Saprospiraceae bacterium]
MTARGIDIPDVDMVVNYDLPDKAENYVHRGLEELEEGAIKDDISFISEGETNARRNIEKYVHKRIKVLNIDKAEYENTILF